MVTINGKQYTDEEFAQRIGKEATKIKDVVHPEKIMQEWMEFINEKLIRR